MNKIVMTLTNNSCDCVGTGECLCEECNCACDCVDREQELISQEDMCICSGNGCLCSNIEEDM